MFEQNERFRAALMQTRGIVLAHSTGENNPYKTILTPTELCGILIELRDNYDKRDKTQELIKNLLPTNWEIWILRNQRQRRLSMLIWAVCLWISMQGWS